MELTAIKNPHPRKPSIPNENVKKSKQPEENPKVIFKQFLSNSFPRYKETVKKAMALIMHLEKHAEKS